MVARFFITILNQRSCAGKLSVPISCPFHGSFLAVSSSLMTKKMLNPARKAAYGQSFPLPRIPIKNGKMNSQNNSDVEPSSRKNTRTRQQKANKRGIATKLHQPLKRAHINNSNGKSKSCQRMILNESNPDRIKNGVKTPNVPTTQGRKTRNGIDAIV